MALLGVGIMVGPIIGPALGGWLCDVYDWRWVFYVNAPIGAVAAPQLFLDRGAELNRFESIEIRFEFGFAVLGLYLYVVHTVTAARPLIDRRVLLDVNMIAGLALIFVIASAPMSTLSLPSPTPECRLLRIPSRWGFGGIGGRSTRRLRLARRRSTSSCRNRPRSSPIPTCSC